MKKPGYELVSAYIAGFPQPVGSRLSVLRELIFKLAPDAEEGFSYSMPGYKTLWKPLIYFAEFPKHIGLYATPSGNSAFAEELAAYKTGKGSVQFPLDQPLPIELIERIVKYRVEENRNIYGRQ